MALLDEKNLAGEAARRARFRVHHVGPAYPRADGERDDRISL
jgi:hypothetical protein